MAKEASSDKPITLEDTERWMGREFPIEGIDEVNRSDIRRKLEVFSFDCPLHYNDDVARAHGYKTIIAPNTMTPLWTMEPYWKPGDPEHYPGEPEKYGPIAGDEIPRPYQAGVNAASEWEFHEPLYPGDRLKGNWKLIEIKPRRTRLGEGAFITVESSFYKQSGELVAVNRNTSFNYEEDPERVKELGAAPRMEPPLMESQVFTLTPANWDKQNYFQDVTAGDEITPHSYPVTYQRIVMGISIDRMFSPVHHNRDFSRQVGLNDIILNTRSYEMLYELTLRKWIGLDGKLSKLGPFRMIQNSHPGDVVTCHGRVAAKEERNGRGWVHLEIWDESHRGVVSQGEADVVLPLRGK